MAHRPLSSQRVIKNEVVLRVGVKLLVVARLVFGMIVPLAVGDRSAAVWHVAELFPASVIVGVAGAICLAMVGAIALPALRMPAGIAYFAAEICFGVATGDVRVALFCLCLGGGAGIPLAWTGIPERGDDA